MHGVRLVRTPPTNTNGSATTGRDDSSVVMSGPSMATDYILHHDRRKFPHRKKCPPCARADARRRFLGACHPLWRPAIASFFTRCHSMAVSRSSSQPPRPTRSSPQARSRRTSIGTPVPPRKPTHIAIECVSPSLDDGRWAVKRILGDSLEVTADIFKDGHDVVAAR